ncbi:DUF418 domain-containing protein [Marinimicrobium sp. ABcell2]|uniref:DUF418 domain-containing protein n=1 Tax=Marinimicrobium sp. ABcell2 TaxID=3069751 RepID=UPI0027B72D2A|nr:DUF418 domain-containing protein [Marinimicrobium sp. ABcell2]MDQ2076742.1 DUF418 domain-containing protein [Marinimicrobium sp. ABcell2]
MSEFHTSNRYPHLDLLRGIAILAILLPNMYSFGLPLAEFFQPGSWLDFSGAGVWAWALIALLVEWKFLTLFALLFGAGIWLFSQRHEELQEDPGPIHYRRCRWLLLFGLLHAYLLWEGDILFTYALCAMVVWPLRRFSPRRQLLLSVGMLALSSLAYWAILTAIPYDMELFPQEDVLAQVEAMRSGWLTQLPVRAVYAFEAQAEVLLFGWRIVGLMLLGMVLMRTGLLLPPRRFSNTALLGVFLVGALITGAGIVGSLRNEFAQDYLLGSYFQAHYWGSIFMALGYAGAVLLWSQTSVLLGLRSRLEAVGRTAFSCYLLQTVICTSVFYGHGLGLYGSLNRLELVAVALSVWVFLLWLAPWWLSRFQYGPLEWVWRGFTYRRWPPLRRAGATT